MALDQLKKAEKEYDQAEDKNATLKQKITQLEAESTCNNKYIDNAVAEAVIARIKKANLKNVNGRLQKELEKTMAKAQAGSTRKQQLEDEEDKRTIAQLKSVIDVKLTQIFPQLLRGKRREQGLKQSSRT
nr:unnamed protein product [Callosobruchus chinensis]